MRVRDMKMVEMEMKEGKGVQGYESYDDFGSKPLTFLISCR